MTLGEYVQRQREWSERTFGAGKRTLGILEHIRKELKEIADDPSASPEALTEWIDVMILAFDGYWRHGGEPRLIMQHLVLKQVDNFAREWPPIQPEDMPTEHIRVINS